MDTLRFLSRSIIFIAMLGAFLGLLAQVPDWQWVSRAGGVSDDYGNSIATDANGYSYITGAFKGTATFGTIELISSGNDDIYVAKIDSSGNWVWAVKGGGSGIDLGGEICIDGIGNIFLTGRFSGTATFGGVSLTSSGGYDVVSAKLSNSGNWLWAVKAGGTSDDYGSSISTDSNGNSYVTGVFSGTVSFGSVSLTSYGGDDIFAAKLNSSGSWIWAKKAGGTNGDGGLDIAVDSNANAYLTGQFYGSANFGTISITSHGSYDAFVAKLDASGNWLWATYAGGIGSIDRGLGITLDSNSNVFVTGQFEDLSIFGSTSFNCLGQYDIFVAKLNSSGSWLWARQAGGVGYDWGYSIAVDANANIIIAGRYGGISAFGNTTLPWSGIYDIYTAKLDNNGNWLWALGVGGPNNDYCHGVSIGIDNSIYITGYILGTVNFGSVSATSIGAMDVYVAQLQALVNTPTFNPPAGTYANVQNVIISCTTPGAQIRYTLDGSEPTMTSSIYSGPITLDSYTVVKAKAYLTGWTPSATATAIYNISVTVATPSFNPPPGIYPEAQSISINCVTPGSQIRYTLDGTDPNATSTLYTSPIYIETDATIKARAYYSNWVPSLIASASYAITGTVATPILSHSSGIYTNSINVSITCSTNGAQVRYSLDGSEPTTSSNLYTSPIYIETTTTLKARAFLTGWTPSAITTANYTITGIVATPSFNPPSGTYNGAQFITILCGTPGAEIHYTLDGTNPLLSSPFYSEPIYVGLNTTIKSRAYLTDWTPSSIAVAEYNIVVGNSDDLISPAFGIHRVYPNPFHSTANFTLSIKEPDQKYHFKIYNLKGECVLHREGNGSGLFDVIWDGFDNNNKRVTPGLYFVSFENGIQRSTCKIVLY